MKKKTKKSKKLKRTKPLSVKCRVKREEPKPVQVTCGTCGMEHDAGVPHYAFCRGTKETICQECGAEMSEDRSVAACRECGKVFCDGCGSTDERRCSDCEDTGDET